MHAGQEGAGREGAGRPCPRVLPVTWGAPPRHPAMMAAAHARRAYPSEHHRYAVTSQPAARGRMVCWGGGHLPCLGSQPTSAAVALPRPLCPPPPHRQCTARPVERHTWASRRGMMRPHTAGGKDTAGMGGTGTPARLATCTDVGVVSGSCATEITGCVVVFKGRRIRMRGAPPPYRRLPTPPPHTRSQSEPYAQSATAPWGGGVCMGTGGLAGPSVRSRSLQGICEQSSPRLCVAELSLPKPEGRAAQRAHDAQRVRVVGREGVQSMAAIHF